MLESNNAFWDDGVWISWDEIDEQIQYKEWRARYPHANLSVVSVFESLLGTARSITRSRADPGVLRDHGPTPSGLRRHRRAVRRHNPRPEAAPQLRAGFIGNDLDEVKTTTPFKSNDRITLNMERNFSKILIVKINGTFEVKGKLVDRASLPRTSAGKLTLEWDALAHSG
ncbi:hypothetical protein [Sphingomonas sp. Leaf412]|uniref:hypothetical protein n=1 Tax=Sphingomonas sp. Leaf412 TaxID=1736370 RepID=UPI001F1FACB5|nr:hypothetical protein [Sphingomonas sp. Leaf412]